jgi:hypothetical protein
VTKKCAGIIGCSSYIFELSRSTNSTRQFLSCASIGFGERFVEFSNATWRPPCNYPSRVLNNTTKLLMANYSRMLHEMHS